MRAYLGARHGIQLASHDELHRLWNTHPELRRVKAEYVFLKQVSEGARYYLADFDPKDVDAARPRLDKIRRTMEPWIEKALKDPTGLA